MSGAITAKNRPLRPCGGPDNVAAGQGLMGCPLETAEVVAHVRHPADQNPAVALVGNYQILTAPAPDGYDCGIALSYVYLEQRRRSDGAARVRSHTWRVLGKRATLTRTPATGRLHVGVRRTHRPRHGHDNRPPRRLASAGQCPSYAVFNLSRATGLRPPAERMSYNPTLSRVCCTQSLALTICTTLLACMAML